MSISDRSDAETNRCVIIGAGPAGLTAAYELSGAGRPLVILEKDEIVGGISRTVEYRGCRFDIGGHRFYTKVPMVEAFWHNILPRDFLLRPRLSRIYYENKLFEYPLKPMNALRGLGLFEAFRVALSYAGARLWPAPDERSLENWVSNRFGRRLYQIFFKTYTEKVWGMPCREISADWAAQRIKNLDLRTAIMSAFRSALGLHTRGVTSLIEQFHYPRRGPGMMWERVAEILAQRGCSPRLGETVIRIEHDASRIVSVTTRDSSGQCHREAGAHFISSMPIRELVHALSPPAPPAVVEAADRLRYRDFLTVGLILDRLQALPDNWIYVHSPEVRVGRIQNYKAWSPDMVDDPDKWTLGLEYFVQEGDELWTMADADLLALGTRECVALGLIRAEDVVDGTVIRMPKSYPVYDGGYEDSLRVLREYLARFTNLQLVGRNGQHRYNNQDHSMVTATYAARNVQGARYDVWAVNVDDDYLEASEADHQTSGASGVRQVPNLVDAHDVTDELTRLFARFDAPALAVAAGLIALVGVLPLEAARTVNRTVHEAGNAWLALMTESGWISAAASLFGWLLASLLNHLLARAEAAARSELARVRGVDRASRVRFEPAAHHRGEHPA